MSSSINKKRQTQTKFVIKEMNSVTPYYLTNYIETTNIVNNYFQNGLTVEITDLSKKRKRPFEDFLDAIQNKKPRYN